MKKPQLEKQFNELRGGIVNVPALLQGIPETPLSEIGLEQYEVSPVEPLHDIKGHLSNITAELRVSLNGETKTKVEAICSTVLGKETLRGSDYRKGSILILHTLQEFQPNSPLTTLFETAVEITEILYSDPSKRCPQSVLRLHNLAFIHAMLCRDQLSSPRTMSSRKLFGRYFHALTCHAPLLYRIISPRLLNTESEERMFGQCKSITRSTSNHHANHVITNILVRIHEEQKLHDVSNTIKKQESEVQTLAGILHHKKNTVIPQAWLHNKSIHYQAHLERIGDYLLQGQGKWWNYVEGGVEFYDIHTPNPLPSLPQIQHYRSTTLGDIESHLLMKWEQCSTEVELPAVHIRTYTCDGSVRNCVSSTHCTRQTPTLPPTPVNSISATTAPDAPLASASATTAPEAPLASASATTTPDAQLASTSATTAPDAQLASASATTTPDAQLASASATTAPDAPLAGISGTTGGPLPPHTSVARVYATTGTPLSHTSIPTPIASTPTNALHSNRLSVQQVHISTTSTPNRSVNRKQLFVEHLSAKTGSLAKCLLTVLPKTSQQEILAFDNLRSHVKSHSSSVQLSPHLLLEYETMSTCLKNKLIEELHRTMQALKQYNPSLHTSDNEKTLQHKVNIAKKVLAHEWKIAAI